MLELKITVDCQRFRPFTFQMALDERQVELLLVRVTDAWQRFASSPIAGVATSLEKEVIASGIYGTHTIEGGSLSEEETAAVLENRTNRHIGNNETAVLNLRRAYEHAKQVVLAADWQLTPQYIQTIHKYVTQDLPHQYNVPGHYRENSKDIVTVVGQPPYKPPQYRADIAACVTGLCAWHTQLVDAGVPSLIRAPLVHYYYELIHPFWDGNGRVGRVLEASILLQGGMNYAPFAQARYYLEHIERYFALFSSTRLAGKAKRTDANTDFVCFFLEGMLTTINHLHDRVNSMTKILLFSYQISAASQAKQINRRQLQILEFIRDHPGLYTRKMLADFPWYYALYSGKTDRTERRDWVGLTDWVYVNENERLFPKI